jgi:DamX protein
MQNGQSFRINLLFLCSGLVGVALFFFVGSAQAASQAMIDPTLIQLNSLTFDQLQQAAEAGDPDAQYALGYMYYYGKKVPQNTAQAMNWIKRAAVQGQDQAVKALALLGQPVVAAAAVTSAPAINNAQNNAQSDAAPAPVKPKAKPVVTETNSVGSAAAPVLANNQQKSPMIAREEADAAAALPPQTSAENLPSTSELLKAPVHYFTIQLLASSSKIDVANYSKVHQLEGRAVYYHTRTNGKDGYVLVYGLYKNRADAQAALAKLPTALRARSPWIKSVGAVQASAVADEG